MLIASTFISNTSFTVGGDRTEAFAVGVRVQADCGADGTFYGTVSDASYFSDTDLTTVTLSLDAGNLTANLTGVLHGNDIPASLVNHGHGNQGDGGTLPDFVRRDNSRAFTQGFISGEGAYTGFKFTETGADVASNAGKWIFQVDNGMFSMLAVDDAESDFNAALTINRDGADPSAVTIAAPYIGLSADDVEASGNIVPPASDPGSLGTASRPWGDVRTGKLLGLDVSGGTVDALVTKASAAEAVTGTDMAKAATPATVRQAVLSLMRDSLGKFPGITPPSLNLFCGDATDDTAPTGTFTRSTTGTRLGQAGLVETVAAGSVRREWGAGGVLHGWCIERLRTNLITYSEQFDNAAWGKYNTTVSANVGMSPDGNTTADKIVESSNSSTHVIYKTVATTLSSAHTFYIFVKKSERSRLALYVFNNASQSNYIRGVFDLDAQTASVSLSGNGSAAQAGLIDAGSGWHLAYVTGIPDTSVGSGTAYLQVRLIDASGNESYLGDGTSGLYAWGIQLEMAASPSSYIPTTSTAAARAADVWTVPLATSWFNMATGTVFIAGRTSAPGDNRKLCSISDGTFNNRYYIVCGSVGTMSCAVVADGTVSTNLSIGTVPSMTTFRVAFSWSTAGVSASLNGAPCITDASVTLPSGLTTCRIGADVAGGSQFGGHISHVAYFPVALSDTQLQAITL